MWLETTGEGVYGVPWQTSDLLQRRSIHMEK